MGYPEASHCDLPVADLREVNAEHDAPDAPDRWIRVWSAQRFVSACCGPECAGAGNDAPDGMGFGLLSNIFLN